MRDNTTWGRRAGVAVVVLAAVGALGACGARGGGQASGGAAESSGPDTFTSKSAEAAGPCATVKVALGDAVAAEAGNDQMRLPLTMTNSGSAACVLRGFPGARLEGADGDGWDLVRSADAINDVRLEPNGKATSYLTFLKTDAANGWAVKSVVVTPPNTTESQTFPWPGGPVVRQDAATHPGTYITPVGAWGQGGA